MLGNGTFHHFRQAYTANQQSGPHNDIIKQMKARVAWKQNESEPLGHCANYDLKRSLRPRNDEKCTSYAMKSNKMDRGLY